ncbi:MAG: anthranilate synthase component I [bacterium]|nr:anthranilate synthase component I [bacterium]
MKLESLSAAPLYRRLRARAEPLLVYQQLYAGERYGFLYESLEEHGTQGRYSFLGGRPQVVFRSKGEKIFVQDGETLHETTGNPLHVLRGLVESGRHALPVSTFPGGAVGYLGYDVVRFFAPVPDDNPDDLDLPDSHFVFPQDVLIFDHRDEVAHLMIYGDDAEARADEIEAMLGSLEAAPPRAQPDAGPGDAVEIRSNMTPEEFEAAVVKAKEYIRAGDVYQVVLSQRFEFPLAAPALNLYAALRRTNPSPYMYFLNLDGTEICGSSPEILVKLTGRRVVTRPLAGTRPRGATPDEDRALADELRADPKECAEHVMLVDLSRNDIGRDCRVGSVSVDRYLEVERYSRVMHLTSDVTGKLRDDRDAFDLFGSTFPAGTVSGAPKIRAMQIIDELEPVRRGPYAGAIGYFSYLGDMDLCIAIRTIVARGNRGYLQAGAGIVADSVPQREYEETLNKARAVVRAVQMLARPAS